MIAQTAATVYAIQYESYGSCSRESIDGPAQLLRESRARRVHCAGARLRAWRCACGCCGSFFEVNGDSLIYGGLAKNLLLHGRYALS